MPGWVFAPRCERGIASRKICAAEDYVQRKRCIRREEGEEM